MASFHLWHPAYVISEPLTLECFITLGDSFLLANGTDAFAAAALQVIGITAPPRSWTMEAMRTHYFSSYREGSDNWEDRWNLAWRLRCVLDIDRAPALPKPPPWGFFDIDAIDRSFHPTHRPQLAQGWNCLLIADAREQAVLDKGRQLVEATFHAESVWGRAFGVFPQLRCDLGYFERAYYEAGATDVEELLRQLQEAGALVRFHHLSNEQKR